MVITENILFFCGKNDYPGNRQLFLSIQEFCLAFLGAAYAAACFILTVYHFGKNKHIFVTKVLLTVENNIGINK